MRSISLVRRLEKREQRFQCVLAASEVGQRLMSEVFVLACSRQLVHGDMLAAETVEPCTSSWQSCIESSASRGANVTTSTVGQTDYGRVRCTQLELANVERAPDVSYSCPSLHRLSLIH